MSSSPASGDPSGLIALSEARAAGMSSAQWRHSPLLPVTRGVKGVTLPTDLAERCRAFALALPDDVAFSHVTAARLWGLPLPVWAQDAGTLDVMRHTRRRPSSVPRVVFIAASSGGRSGPCPECV